MAYIVFDLEWNQPYPNDFAILKKVQQTLAGEIIQIGAVRLNERFEIEGQFNVIIKPKYLTKMHHHVGKLTGITTEAINSGVSFVEAYLQFKNWCGTNPVLITWGEDDLLVMKQNLKLHRMQTDFSYSWYDGQKIYAALAHQNQAQVSLLKAVAEQSLATDLEAHDALNDARYTADVLVSFGKDIIFKEMENTERYQSMHALFADEITFAIFGPMQNQVQGLRLPSIQLSRCPICESELNLLKMERINNGKYLSLGRCQEHGCFSVLWRVYKHSKKNKVNSYYISRSLYSCNDKIVKHYHDKARLNKIKEEKYLLIKQKIAEEGKSE